MLYEDQVTLQMKTTAYGNPTVKTLDADAELTPIGSRVQIDLDLNNNDLRLRRFKIEVGSTILHKSSAFRCEECSTSAGTPHSFVDQSHRVGVFAQASTV